MNGRPPLRPLPLTPPHHPEEPLRSLLTRTADLLGIDLALLCQHVGGVNGDPRRWSGIRANFAAGERLAALLDTELATLAHNVPEVAAAEQDALGPTLQQRHIPRPWFAQGPATCTPCTTQRDGAARASWEHPWALVCVEHSQPLRPTYIRCLDAVPGITEGQKHMDSLATASPERTTASAPLAWYLLQRHAQRGPLHVRAMDRAVMIAPPLRTRSRFPSLPIEILLLPELAVIVECLQAVHVRTADGKPDPDPGAGRRSTAQLLSQRLGIALPPSQLGGSALF